MLVDGDSQTFDAIEQVQKQRGIPIECIWITSAFKALINLKAIEPDILIAELGMAHVDGYDLLRTVRENHPPGTLMLVGVTAVPPSQIALLGNVPADTTLVQKPVPMDWFHGYFASHIALHTSTD